jgi:hypothetical protein
MPAPASVPVPLLVLQPCIQMAAIAKNAMERDDLLRP